MLYELGWGYYAGALGLWLLVSHYLSMATNTLYLHRYLAHGSFVASRLFRELCKFEVWIKSGMNPWYWAAVHRKHHAYSDQPDDPHSPKWFGKWRILFGQAHYYRRAIMVDPKIMRFVPEMEENLTFFDRWVYCSRYLNPMGPVLFLVINCILFGLPGVLVWLVLIADVPAAGGIINGLGHWQGTPRDIVKKDFWVFGEMLHGRHHQFPWSAYFAHAKDEFDPGKPALRFLGKIGFAKNAKFPGQLGEHLIDPLT